MRPKHTGDDACKFCGGYGNIWVGWHPTPVQCGHCHGTGASAPLSQTPERP